MDKDPIYRVQRRVAGEHDHRLDGLTDFLGRARDASILDLGCNRGMVGLEFARNGATTIAGIDYDQASIEIARAVFADCRYVRDYRFECINLTQGVDAITKVLGSRQWTMVLMLATLHKLRKQMEVDAMRKLCTDLGHRTSKYFIWRGTESQDALNAEELQLLDAALSQTQMRRIHTSFISDLGPTAAWSRF